MKISKLIMLILIGSLGLAVTVGLKSAECETLKEDNVLNVATISEPASLDPHVKAVISSRDPQRLVFETLVTKKSDNQIVPLLAESVKTEDNQTYIFKLRKGVKFHNGKEMTSEDVVASMERWFKHGRTGKFFDASIKAVDDYTVILEVDHPSPFVLSWLAVTVNYPGIMPKEIADKNPDSFIEEYVGTGPFKYVDWRRDSKLHFEKFKDYEPLDQPSDGLAGERLALVDDVYFHFISDHSTATAGLQTGDYDIALDLAFSFYDQIYDLPNIETLTGFHGNFILLFDKREGIFRDPKMRAAVNYAINREEIMKSAFYNEQMYTLNPSWMFEHQTQWYTLNGSEKYTVNGDREKSRKLLKEAGYDGEQIIFITTRTYEHIFTGALTIQAQLETVGMNVKVEVFDQATVFNRRKEPGVLDMYLTGFGMRDTPGQYPYMTNAYFDGPKPAEFIDLMEKHSTATSMEEAVKYWEKAHEIYYRKHVNLKLGEFNKLYAYSDKVDGFSYFDGPILWNTSISK